MGLTLLGDLTAFEVSFVPFGANKKKRFLVTKELNGVDDMKKLLEQILKEGCKDEEAVMNVAKNLNLNDEETQAFKAVMKIVGADSSPLKQEKLMKALNEMGVKKEDPKEPKEAEGDNLPPKKPEDDPKDDQVNKEGDDPNSIKGGGMKVPVQKEDGSWDLSGVDEKLRPALEAVCKSNETLSKSLKSQQEANQTLADKLKSEKDHRVLKEFEEKAKTFGHLGEEATKVAKILKSAYEADPENGKAMEEILKSANSKLEQADLFKEAGISGENTMPGADAWTKIEKAAEEISKEDSKITKAQAVDMVMRKHPELYKEYQDQKRGGVK